MILYSHRPKLGVSVAAKAENGILRIAVATTHNRLDTFSRQRARQILAGRLQSPMTVAYKTNLTVHDFMNAFKAWFKPTPDESDDTFPKKLSKRRDKIIELIMDKTQDIIVDSEAI